MSLNQDISPITAEINELLYEAVSLYFDAGHGMPKTTTENPLLFARKGAKLIRELGQ